MLEFLLVGCHVLEVTNCTVGVSPGREKCEVLSPWLFHCWLSVWYGRWHSLYSLLVLSDTQCSGGWTLWLVGNVNNYYAKTNIPRAVWKISGVEYVMQLELPHGLTYPLPLCITTTEQDPCNAGHLPLQKVSFMYKITSEVRPAHSLTGPKGGHVHSPLLFI